MSRKKRWLPVKFPLSKSGKGKNNMCEVVCQVLQYILCVLASLTIMFLPLCIAIPGLLRRVPFYGEATYALDKICKLEDEREFSYPEGGETQRLRKAR